MLVSEGKHFCCKGCQAVYELIQSKDLGDFYERLGKNTLKPVDFKNFAEFFAKFRVFGLNLGLNSGKIQIFSYQAKRSIQNPHSKNKFQRKALNFVILRL